MRPCCKCGKSWESTRSEWINGTCPHCGAYGADGNGGKFTSFNKKPLEESITDILPTHNNEHNRVSFIEDFSEGGNINNQLILPPENKNYIIFTRIENNNNK